MTSRLESYLPYAKIQLHWVVPEKPNGNEEDNEENRDSYRGNGDQRMQIDAVARQLEVENKKTSFDAASVRVFLLFWHGTHA